MEKYTMEKGKQIYYSDFGAKGDGVTDDFYAVRAAHIYANEHGCSVHAEPGKSYYFGKGSGTDSIIIKTDTYWHGARIIFDDSNIVYEDPEYQTPVIIVAPDHDTVTYTAETAPINSIAKGATNIGFAPGFRAMVVLYDDNVRQYIRDAGKISDNGTAQHELVMVAADGTIDPTTPLQWTYNKITKLEITNVEDAPITISGADDGQGIVETVSNHAPTDNRYLSRIIMFKRSNITFKNVRHMITNEEISDTGAPYNGFTHTMRCENVTFENLTLQRYKVFNTYYRSYEIRGTLANNVTWRNCNMSNFFAPDGYTVHQGMMGTNYCKNLTLDGVQFNTFDCHHGCYNVTIRNSTLVYVSAIGEGVLTVENCTFYICNHCIVIWLRSDYGTTWYGDLNMKDITVKYSDRNRYVTLVNSWWTDHWFGYPCKLPTNITLENFKSVKYEATVDDGVRTERIIGENIDPVNFFLPDTAKLADKDISRLKSEGGDAEENSYKAPEQLVISNCDGVDFRFPNIPMFRDMRVTVDGEEYDWKSHSVPHYRWGV